MKPLPLRVLVVTPRPLALESLASLALTEALYDALEAQGDQAEAERLWPGSLEALAARLGDDGLPAVDVVYLDALLAQAKDGPGFCFEAAGAEAQVVSPGQLAAVVGGQSAPLVILAAWGRGQDVGALRAGRLPEALVAEGLPRVISVTEGIPIERTTQAMTTWFAAVLAGHPAGHALSQSQVRKVLELYQSGEDVPLIQAMPAGAGGIGKVISFPASELLPAWQRLAVEPEPGGLPPGPPQGFFGRGREIAALERAARTEAGNGIVLVHGYEGMGKTTLVVHAARWLVRVGRFSQVVYTSFAGGGHREAALCDLGVRLLGDSFDPAAQDAVEIIERALTETPSLVIWDGMEALLEEGAFALQAQGLGELLQLGARLAATGASRLYVVSDSPALPDASYAQGSVSLDLSVGGLEAGDALDLLDGLLRTAGLSPSLLEEASDLVGALGGHPLALCVVSALLGEHSPAEVVGLLEEILPGLRTGEGHVRNQALDVALEALLRSFDETRRHRLLALGVFACGFMQPLAKTVASLEEGAWADCKRLLSSAQLLHDVRLPGLSVAHVHLHPSLPRQLSRRLSPQERASLDQLHCGSYLGLLKWMTERERGSAAQVEALLRRETPNFRRAMQTLLARWQLSTAISYARLWQRFLGELGYRGESERVARELQEAVAEALPSEGPLGRSGVQFLLKQGEQMLLAGRVAEAGQLLGNLCARIDQEGGLSYAGDDALLDQALALHQLGRCFRATARADVAVGPLRRALDLFNGLQPKSDVRRALVLVLVDLGDAHMESVQPDQAREAYQRAVALAGELEDERTAGEVKAKLGAIAMASEDASRARQLFEGALEHLKGVNDLPGMANVWHQLGTLAWRNSDLAEAQRCYDRALDLSEQSAQFLLQAQTLMQLAQMAEQTGRAHDAETGYAQAIRIYQEHNVYPALASAEVALAGLLLREGQLQSARAHAEAARAIVKDLGPGARPWVVYSLLQRIAQAEGDEEREARWRARAQESFADSSEAKRVVEQWQTVIRGVAKACRGEALDGDTLNLLENMETGKGWEQLVAAIWRILGGERGEDLYAALDPIDAVVVRHTLEAIESPDLDQDREEEASAPGTQTEEAAKAVSLPFLQLMAAVAAALKGDPQAQSAVAVMLDGMTQEGSPEPVKHLAQTLRRIMRGERDPAVLQGLPDEMAAPLRSLLESLAPGKT